MLILLGSKWKYKPVSDGMAVERHCPECGEIRRFREVRPTQFFTLFFLPVVKMSEKKPVLQCLRCQSSFVVSTD